jgi:hypothetical protein
MKILDSIKAWHPTQKQIELMSCWFEIFDHLFPIAAALVLFYLLVHVGLAVIPTIH